MLGVLARGLSRIVLISMLAGLIGSVFVRLGPGFGASTEDLNPRLSDATRAEIQRKNSAGSDVTGWYAQWLRGLVHGDLGSSPSLKRPITDLLRERAGMTATEVAAGGAIGVAAGFVLAVVTLACPRAVSSLLCGLGSSAALSLPAAVIALICLWLDANPLWAVAAAVMPHALHYLTGVLSASAASDHVLAARARGLKRSRILFRHVVTPVAGELAAVAGMAVSIALGASIPIEAICSRAGIGQLVWQAALARDLPVLVNVTVLLAIVTIGANTVTDVVIAARNPVRGNVR